MSDHPPRPLAEMRRRAEQLRMYFEPVCERIEIAGSIRREKPECSDVELVCVPRFGVDRSTQATLFDLGGRLNLLDQRINENLAFSWRLDARGRIASGPRYKLLSVTLSEGDAPTPLDLFSVLPPAEWGVILLIRTGPADFSRRVVTSVSARGWMPEGWCVKDGAIHDAGGRIVPTPEEADVFRVLGREYVEPEARR